MVEAMIAMSVLTVLGLVLLKLSINILHPRQWVLQQTVSDAYMTYERAYAERIPFDNLVANDSPWPASTITIGAVTGVVNVTSTSVEIGRLPGGRTITGTVVRTRFPDAVNYPIDGGNGNLVNNPAAMKVWRVQSVLTYTIGNRTYSKSRTVIRSQ